MEHLRLPDPNLVVDGHRLECQGWLAYAGAYQLTIWTVVPELALELHTSYLGHPDSDTAVSHLQLRLGDAPLSRSEQRAGGSLPVREARRLCLYDHLAALRDLLTEHTSELVRIEITNRALQRVDVA